ncbi:hypothetical protein DCM91_07160 [Chitinophaga costaii]|nr:hypothetical protein DCM91_07160 [Chitinophaga costaii]
MQNGGAANTACRLNKKKLKTQRSPAMLPTIFQDSIQRRQAGVIAPWARHAVLGYIGSNGGFFIFLLLNPFVFHDKCLSLMLDFTKGQIIKHQT